MSLSDSKKRLALSIIDFLSTSLKDGTLTAEDAENVEVASNCIAEAFKVDPNDTAAVNEAVGSQPLLNIYTVYERLKGKSTPSTTGPSSAEEARPATPSAKPKDAPSGTPASATSSTPNPEAEKLKSAGNAAMQQKDYKVAIEKYTQAISYHPTNPIYLSNRAAAYSASGEHQLAINDAELAVAADPKYTKAWSRLGLAKFAMGDARGSASAYENGIEYEGSGGSDAMRKGLETAKKEVARMEAQEQSMPEDEVDDASSTGRGMPDLSSLAGMFGGGAGGGGGGGGGGMPDLAGLMNNPMFGQMARNLMSNPDALGTLMNNPTIRNMMQNRGGGGGGSGAGAGGEGGGGGGMPDMSQIQQMMQDPAIANLASQFMGGGADGGAGAGAGAGRGAGR